MGGEIGGDILSIYNHNLQYNCVLIEQLLRDLDERMLHSDIGIEKVREVVTAVREINTSSERFMHLCRTAFMALNPDRLEVISVDISRYITLLCDSIRASKKNINPTIETEFSHPKLIFECPPELLEPCIVILIDNAIKYSKKKPVVQVSADLSARGLRISVKDNGIGIAKRDQEKIFEMWYRSNEERDGHGLGLYIVKRFMDFYGGTVTLKSAPNKGSEFTLFFPTRESSSSVVFREREEHFLSDYAIKLILSGK